MNKMATEKRLIDANDLREAVITDYYEHFTRYHDTDQVALIDMVCEDIGNAHTVDAVPVDLIKLHHVIIDNEGVPEVKLQIGDRYFLLRTDPVDVREVVHGRWVIEKRHTVSRNPYMDDNYHAHATCSECGFCIHSENASFGYPKLNTTNYCPNCGAYMMDGDGNG